MSNVEPLDPWERQPGESKQSWESFQAYRDLPPHERSLRKVAETKFPDSNLKARRGRLGVMSSKWRWVERAQAWDRHIDEMTRKELAYEIVKTRERHIKMATAMEGKLMQRLATLDPSSLTPHDLVTWFKVTVKIKRQALGMDQAVVRPKHPPARAVTRFEEDVLQDPKLRPLYMDFLERVERVARSNGNGH